MLWITRKEWNAKWDTITKHIRTINGEMGTVQNDIKWLKWLICAVFLAVILGLARQFLGL